MKAALLPRTQRGATRITSTRRRPLPAQTPPEEGPSSSDCLHRKHVNTVWLRSGGEGAVREG